ncbi:MAG: ATP-dependent Clp protease ATP-binding subunit [Bradymonadaceae bacterium]|nr:ATP-dependent Clp protease ATP-binding subunit [Lujinxingiaceae bacterium]
MKLRLSVALRRYGDDIYIAQTLAFPLVSAAAASRVEVFEKLSRSLVHVLGHLHPRLLCELGRPIEVLSERLRLPLFGDHASLEADDHDDDYPRYEGDAEPALMAVDVVARRFGGGLVHLQMPLFHVGTWMFEEAGAFRFDADGGAIAELLRSMRAWGAGGLFSRATPEGFEIEQIEVDVAPLDLAEVPDEMRWRDYFDAEDLIKTAGSERAPVPTLESVAQLWADSGASTAQALELAGARFGPVFGRDEALGELGRLLEGKIPAAVVLVGPARVGKTALVKAFGRRLLEAPPGAEARRLWFADAPRLCATEPMSPGWQQQCRELARELELAGDVLYMGRLVEALDAGKYVGSDYNLAQFFKPHLADRRIRVVAEATIEEWNLVERRDIGFARAFTVMRIDDPAPGVDLEIVRKASALLAKDDGITIGEEAIARAWGLQRRFATAGSPVGRTIDFVARTLNRAVQQRHKTIDVGEMVESFCEDTGMPAVILLDDRTLDLEAVRARLTRRVMGQASAVLRVADIVGVTKAGLAADDRPLGSFLFVGLIGVGKTELARALAEFLFGNEKRLVRLDMSEYANADGYNRLIGQGNEDGDLTGPVRRQPFSVVLLDEIEKAHANVFDLLLQVLGEARLTDANGRMTRFQNTIIILTSNLGVDSLRPTMGFSDGTKAQEGYVSHFRREAEKFFRPEFLARIDQFIAFEPLSAETITAIAKRELDGLHMRDGLLSRDTTVAFGSDVPAWLAKRGWDKRYGARPIKRVVEREIVWPLAAKLAERDQGPGGPCRVTVEVEPPGDIDSGRLVWRVEAVSEDLSGASRKVLLGQLEQVAELRRRLQHCLYADVFSDLEWQVNQYDISSQSAHFWKDPEAADMARRSEEARKVVDPVLLLQTELSALEDLATEAYHSRTFDIVPDLAERVDELALRIEEVFLTVMRTVYEEPDQIVLFMASRNPHDPWRAQLIDWYGQLCSVRGWRMKIWRARTDFLEEPDREDHDWRRQWAPTSEARGGALAIEIEGHGVRPLLQGDNGLHRMIAQEGNAVIDVVVLREDEQYPQPAGLEDARSSASTVRIWNFRTREVTLADFEPRSFDPRNPWPAVMPALEEIAWQLVDLDWY